MSRLLLSLLLLMAGCSSLTVSPEPLPPLAPYPQEINRGQSMNLQQTGTISVSVQGSPDDALRAIEDKASKAGMSWYRVLLLSETVVPGYWYSTAVLYGPSVAAHNARQ